jgi:MFS family permease
MGSSALALAVGALVFGASLSLTTGPALALVTELVPADAHARVQGYNGAIQGMSALGGALIAGFLATALGPSPSFWALVAVMAIVAMIVLFIRERPRAPRFRPPGLRQLAQNYGRVLNLFRTEPAIRMASTVSLSYQLQMLTLENAFLPIFLVTVRGYSATTIGLMLAVRSLVGVLLSSMFGRLFVRFGLVRPVIVGSAIGLAGAIAVPLVDQPAMLVILFALQGAGVAFGPATANLLITSATSESERATGFSANGLVGRIAGLTLPLAFGIAIQFGGFALLFALATIVGSLAIVAMAYIAKNFGAWDRTATPVSEPL